MNKQNKLFYYQQFKNQGFTLIEVLVVVGIFGILTILIADFINQSLFMQNYISQQSEATKEASQGVENLTKELREAADGDTGAYPIELADEQEIIFYSDIDADAYTEKIRYFIEDNSLKKGIIEPSGEPLTYSGEETITSISSHIINDENSVFYYFSQDYPADATPLTYPADATKVSLIKIHLEINVNPDKIPDTYTLETFIQARNLKNNL